VTPQPQAGLKTRWVSSPPGRRSLLDPRPGERYKRHVVAQEKLSKSLPPFCVRRMLAIQNPNVKRKIGPPGEKLERFPADAGENAISTVSERSYMSEISSRKRGKTKSSEGKWRE